ncbi:MAG: hypothetical protein ACYDC6_16350 [Acidobacteriaceae bacterium]
MPHDDFYGDEDRASLGLLLLLAGLGFFLAVAGLAWIVLLQDRLSTAETEIRQQQKNYIRLLSEQSETRRELLATTDALGAKVGVTQRQIEDRAGDLLRDQRAANSRLALQQAEIRRQVGNVSTAVSSVRTDVGGVKQDVATNSRDVASARQELAATEQQLHAAIGDMGVQSGLIARNSDQLAYLKHLGDRNYFEFTLRKGRPPTAIASVKLQLRKADAKHSRYTLLVFSNDKRLEKKNRQADEPLQFYTGKQPVLFEIVVNRIEKNQVSGYLSTPKIRPSPNAP